MSYLSKYLDKLKYNKYKYNKYDSKDFCEIETFVHKIERELRNLKMHLHFHKTRSGNLAEFLAEIEAHPSLQSEWKRFRILYKTITGNETPSTK